MDDGEMNRNQNKTAGKIVTFERAQKARGNNNLMGKGWFIQLTLLPCM